MGARFLPHPQEAAARMRSSSEQSCYLADWGGVGGGEAVGREGPLFVLMLSVRILGDGSWQLFTVGPGCPPLSPTLLRSPLIFPMYRILYISYWARGGIDYFVR